MDMRGMQREVHALARAKGWHDHNDRVTFGDRIALIHSEASEALNEYRNGHDFTEIYYHPDERGQDKPEGIPIELADIVIRVADACELYGIDLANAIAIKHAYNETREYRHGNKRL